VDLLPGKPEDIVPDKVHIRGLDDMSTDDVKAYAEHHFSEERAKRIEWIDDHSCNMVFSDNEVSARALEAMAAPGQEEMALVPIHLRPARPSPSFPSVQLYVRIAQLSDKKQPKAYERSRYYLMNPDADPMEKRNRERESGGRRGRRSRGRGRYDDDGDYNRRRYNNREDQKRTDDDREAGYDENMYDDTPDALASRSERKRAPGSRRWSSHSTHSSSDGRAESNLRRRATFGRNTGREGRDRELFPEKAGASNKGTLRNRSGSPGRDRSASPGMDFDRDDKAAGSRRSHRQRTPPPSYGTIYPNGRPNSNIELFPDRVAGHRSGPQVLDDPLSIQNKSDLTDDLLSNFSSKMSVPLVDGASDERPGHSTGRLSRPSTRTLEDRISRPGSNLSIHGSSKQRDLLDDARSSSRNKRDLLHEVSIAGLASKGDLLDGFAVRGTANAELFPEKVKGGNNVGKELFPEGSLKGRGRVRKGAEDHW
jgi:Nuclear cap-binding protein subunit 3